MAKLITFENLAQTVAKLKLYINTATAAASAKLKTARAIGLSGVTNTAQKFDGSADITIPITAVPASLITGTLSNNTTGNAATATNATNAANATYATTADQATKDGTGNNIASTYLPLSGGTLTGILTLAGAPTADLQSATKGYVDTAVGGVMSSRLAKNGYIKFGNGVLVQWGVCTISTWVSFPIPFSSTNYSVVVTPTGNNDSGYQNTRIPDRAQGSFYVAGANWSDGNWVAIGY